MSVIEQTTAMRDGLAPGKIRALIAKHLGVEIEREGFETVGGFLLSHLGRMPYVGEIVEIDELVFEVLEVERRRISKVRVRRRIELAEEG